MELQKLAHHLETIVREGVKNILLNTDIELKNRKQRLSRYSHC